MPRKKKEAAAKKGTVKRGAGTKTAEEGRIAIDIGKDMYARVMEQKAIWEAELQGKVSVREMLMVIIHHFFGEEYKPVPRAVEGSRVKHVLSLAPETRDHLKELVASSGKTYNEVIADLVAAQAPAKPAKKKPTRAAKAEEPAESVAAE